MKFTQIIPMALQSFRVNPFHTFLSCLGIIIGVGALFSVLSLADGMEQLARDKVAERANLKSFSISAKTHEMVDNLRIPRENIANITFAQVRELDTLLQDSNVSMVNRTNAYLKRTNDTLRTGSTVMGLMNPDTSAFGAYTFIEGGLFSQTDIDNANPVIVITKPIADKLFPMLGTQNVMGKEILFKDKLVTIVGILKSTEEKKGNPYDSMKAAIPISLYSTEEMAEHRPRVSIAVQTIESYESEQAIMETFLDDNFEEGHKAFNVSSYSGIMKEVQDAMLIFKIIMGMIVGISVVVGGIGIMNVMLMTIKERTKEIGVRKAIGASSSSIKWQFLTEALFLSFIGSVLGVLLGIAFLTLAMAILSRIPQAGEMPFDWAFSWGTTATIATVTILIGLVFGTYPAAKASRLDPIDAIRHE